MRTEKVPTLLQHTCIFGRFGHGSFHTALEGLAHAHVGCCVDCSAGLLEVHCLSCSQLLGKHKADGSSLHQCLLLTCSNTHSRATLCDGQTVQAWPSMQMMGHWLSGGSGQASHHTAKAQAVTFTCEVLVPVSLRGLLSAAPTLHCAALRLLPATLIPILLWNSCSTVRTHATY
jgi:hypothetical protein